MRYEEYKETGYRFCPALPASWNMKSGRFCFGENKKKNTDLTEKTLLQFTYGSIVRKKNQEITKDDEPIIAKYTVVQPFDIIVNGLNLNYDFVSQRVGLVNEAGVITSAYLSLRCHNVYNPYYANYMLKALDAQKIFHGMGSGVRLTLGYSEFSKIKFPVPPREEQDQIVRYLDWKVSCINKLIHGYQRQIKLLEERRLFIINKAVTQGIKKDTSLKDSGNSWIGAVPSHWDVVPLRRAYTVVLGKMLTPYSTSETDTLEEYICAKDVHFNDVSIQNLKKMWYSPSEKEQYRVKEGDLLVVEGGAGAGNTAIAKAIGERDIFVQNSVHIIRAKEGISLNSYLNNWMYSLIKRGYMNYICSVATIPHYTKEKVMVTAIPLPPLEEQYAISEYIGEKCKRIDDTIRILEEQIALLKEYRTRLISDVVTGQMDVRDVAVPEYVPEADEEGAELDETLSNADEETEV